MPIQHAAVDSRTTWVVSLLVQQLATSFSQTRLLLVPSLSGLEAAPAQSVAATRRHSTGSSASDAPSEGEEGEPEKRAT
jgi:hypothetical protein